MPCRHDSLFMNAVVECWRRGSAHHGRTGLSIAAGLTLVLAGCATPVRVDQVEPREVERQLDSNVLSTGAGHDCLARPDRGQSRQSAV